MLAGVTGLTGGRGVSYLIPYITSLLFTHFFDQSLQLVWLCYNFPCHIFNEAGKQCSNSLDWCACTSRECSCAERNGTRGTVGLNKIIVRSKKEPIQLVITLVTYLGQRKWLELNVGIYRSSVECNQQWGDTSLLWLLQSSKEVSPHISLNGALIRA